MTARTFGADGRFALNPDVDIEPDDRILDGPVVTRELPHLGYTQHLVDGWPVDPPETKSIRRVRTPEGAEHFGQPIGSIISDAPEIPNERYLPEGHDRRAHLRAELRKVGAGHDGELMTERALPLDDEIPLDAHDAETGWDLALEPGDLADG